MDYIKVNTEAMKSDYSELLNVSKSTLNLIKKAQDSIQVLNSTWEGPAKQAFIEQFNADVELFNNICTLTSEFAGDLLKGAKEYEKCENAIYDAVRSMSI